MSKLAVLKNNNKGTTLVEMLVCFVLLSIFITSAAMIITSTTNLYYQVKAQTYSDQVQDIVLEKIVSEIEGTKFADAYSDNLKITIDDAHDKVTLYDRTDTKISMYAENEELIVFYHPIHNDEVSFDSTEWKFDKNVYNGYKIKELKFYKGSETIPQTLKDAYNLDEHFSYDENIVLVFLTMNNPKYGEFKTVRPVKCFYK